MKIKSVFALMIFTLSTSTFISGQLGIKEHSIEKQIIGKWNAFSLPDLKLDVEFTEDGYYNYIYDGKVETNMIIDDILYHQLTYEIVEEENQKRLLIFGEEPKNLVENHLVEFHEGKLYRVTYKMMKGITHHIDEYYWWGNSTNELSNSQKKNKIQAKTKIIFPKKFKGLALIAFEEKSGVPAQIKENNLEMIFIPKNGQLKTQTKPNPFAFAKKEVVYFIEKEDGSLEEVEMIYGNRFTGELKDKNLNANKLYLLNFGFNQIDRPRVNSKLFKSEVKNDVLFLSIGTPNELSQIWEKTIESIQ